MPKLFLILLVLSFMGCNSTYGVRNDVWETLSPDQKSAIITSYNERKAEEAKLQLEKEKRETERIERINAQINNDAPHIIVIIRSGTITVQNKPVNIISTRLDLTHGHSTILSLNQAPDSPRIPNIPVSYVNGAVHIGDTSDGFDRSINLGYSESWKRGKNYPNTEFPFFSRIKGSLDISISLYEKNKKRSLKRVYQNVDRVFKDVF